MSPNYSLLFADLMLVLCIMLRTGLRMPLEAELNALEAIASEQDSLLSDRFRVLDVGACHSRIMDRLKGSFDVTAFDLEPAHEFVGHYGVDYACDSNRVLWGDFLSMKILQDGPPVVSEAGNLLGVRKGSMDIVVLSLVLSYLPDVILRCAETEAVVSITICRSAPSPVNVYY